MEKVGLANIFHDLSLENVARPTFSTFFHEFLRKFYSSRKCWKMLARPTFSTIFVKNKTSSEIHGKVETVGLATFSRLRSWKMLARPTFSAIFVMYQASSEIRGAVELQAIVLEIMGKYENYAFCQ